MNRVLGAVLAGLVLLTLLLLVSQTPASLASLLREGLGMRKSTAAYCALLAAVVLCWYGTAFAIRFALRFAPTAVGRPTRRWLALVLSCVLILLGVLDLRGAFLRHGIDAVRLGHSSAALALYFFPGIALLALVQLRGNSRGPVIVFLRRFGSASDRQVLAAIIRNMPADCSCALLVAPGERLAALPALLLGILGMRLTAPFSRLAFYYTASNEEWLGFVRQRVEQANCVVLDLTEDSTSIRQELDVVRLHARDRLIVLLEGERATPEHARDLLPQAGERVVRFASKGGLSALASRQTQRDLKLALEHVLREFPRARPVRLLGAGVGASAAVLLGLLRIGDEEQAANDFDCESARRYLSAISQQVDDGARLSDFLAAEVQRDQGLARYQGLSRAAHESRAEAATARYLLAPPSLPWGYVDELSKVEAARSRALAAALAVTECSSVSAASECREARRREYQAARRELDTVSQAAREAMPACCKRAGCGSRALAAENP